MTAMGPGVKVMRSWFFQRMATTNGQRDWSGFDHTLAVAKAHGIKVIATLANQWPDCEPASGYKDEAWYTTGYTQPDPSGTVSYRSWVGEVAARYKDDPTIMAWQLINEAEVKPYAGSGKLQRLCQGHPRELGDRRVGRRQGRGSQPPRQPGNNRHGPVRSVGPRVLRRAQHPDDRHLRVPRLRLAVDPASGRPVERAVEPDQHLQRARQADDHRRVGINPSDVGGYQGRAAAFKAKFEQEFGAGVDGIIPWAWDINGSTPNDYDIGPGDPLLGVMASATQPDHTCRGPKLVVAAGVNCNITGWTFSSVTVKPGGALRLYFSAVTGTLSANGAAAIDLDTSSPGSVQITNTPAAGTVRLCGVNASNTTLKGNASPLTIGGPGCEGQFRSLSVTLNTGGVTIQGNTIARTLACTKNVPAPAGGGNTAATKTGQCAAL